MQIRRSPAEIYLQIVTITLLVLLCLWVIAPFVTLVIWAVIIAVAVYPAFTKLATMLGGRKKLAASLLVLLGLLVLVVPAWLMTDSSINATQSVAANLQGGEVSIPPPADKVASWPLIGKQLHALWSQAANDLESLVNQFRPQLISVGETVIKAVGGVVLGVVQFVASIFIAGVLLLSAGTGYRACCTIATALSGEHGRPLTDMSIATIRSVSKGVVGVAMIQALLAAIGLVVAGVPAAGIWASLVLVVAVIQLPPLLILGPIAVWVFSVADTGPAVVFLVYSIIVSLSDGFLKPMLLGRGMDIPMLVILIGAIGGAISAGLLGLFLGPVVLAVGYKILVEWMALHESQLPADSAELHREAPDKEGE